MAGLDGVAQFSYRVKLGATFASGEIRTTSFTIQMVGTQRVSMIPVAVADDELATASAGAMAAFFGLSDPVGFKEHAAAFAGSCLVVGDVGTLVKNLWRCTPFTSKQFNALETTLGSLGVATALGLPVLKPIIAVLRPLVHSAAHFVRFACRWIRTIMRSADDVVGTLLQRFMDGPGGLVTSMAQGSSATFNHILALSGDAAAAGARESDNVLHMQAANATAFKKAAKPGHHSNYDPSAAKSEALLGGLLSPHAARESERQITW